MEALEAEEQEEESLSKRDEVAKRKQSSADKDGDSFNKQLMKLPNSVSGYLTS